MPDTEQMTDAVLMRHLATGCGEVGRQAAERLRALRATLDDLYPALAGRVIQLQAAQEDRAAERWNGYCVQIQNMLDGR